MKIRHRVFQDLLVGDQAQITSIRRCARRAPVSCSSDDGRILVRRALDHQDPRIFSSANGSEQPEGIGFVMIGKNHTISCRFIIIYIINIQNYQ